MMQQVARLVQISLLLIVSCCSGCTSYLLVQNASNEEDVKRPSAAYVGSSGDLLLEVELDSSKEKEANCRRYIAIKFEDIAPVVPVTANNVRDSELSRIWITTDVPHTYVSTQAGCSKVFQPDSNLLQNMGERIDLDPKNGPVGSEFLYVHGNHRAMITRTGLVGAPLHAKRASVPGTILCYVLIVPAIAIDVVTFPIQAVWIATGGGGFSSHHAN